MVKQLNLDSTETSQTTDHKYQVGDLVTILKFNRVGELIKKQKNKTWLVKMGTLNSTFNEDDIFVVNAPESFQQYNIISIDKDKILQSITENEDDMLDKAWGLEPDSRLSCQALTGKDDLVIESAFELFHSMFGTINALKFYFCICMPGKLFAENGFA